MKDTPVIVPYKPLIEGARKDYVDFAFLFSNGKEKRKNDQICFAPIPYAYHKLDPEEKEKLVGLRYYPRWHWCSKEQLEIFYREIVGKYFFFKDTLTNFSTILEDGFCQVALSKDGKAFKTLSTLILVRYPDEMDCVVHKFVSLWTAAQKHKKDIDSWVLFVAAHVAGRRGYYNSNHTLFSSFRPVSRKVLKKIPRVSNLEWLDKGNRPRIGVVFDSGDEE